MSRERRKSHPMNPAREMFFAGELAFRSGDFAAAQRSYGKALELAIAAPSADDIYMIYCGYVELHWRQGYSGAKEIREKGLYNSHLRKVQDYALTVVDMLGQGLPSYRFTSCPPIDRLCLLYKLTGQQSRVSALLSELERIGRGELQEVVNWRAELAKAK